MLKISVKARFPILKLPFSFNFIYCMLWFWQRFWEPCNIFFWIFMVPYKIPHLCNNKNTIWLKIYTCFLSEITIYNFPTWPGCPCIIILYSQSLLVYYMQYWPSSFMELREIFHPTRLLGTFSPYSFKGFLPKSPPPRLLPLLVY